MTSLILTRLMGLGICVCLGDADAEKKPAERGQATVEVFVAKVDVSAGTQLTRPEQLFKRVRYVKGDEPRSSLRDWDKLRGKILRRSLSEDQPLRESDLADRAPEVPALAALPRGMRAFAMRVSSGAGEEFALPGSRVDVIASKQLPNGDSESRVRVRDVLVLAVDGEAGEGPAPRPRVMTVAVTPEQATILSAAAGTSSFHVELRAPTDK